MPPRPARPAPADAPPADDDPWAEKPSKSQRKREAHDLQALGLALAELPASRLAPVAMPEALRSAIAEYQRTKSHEGRRRQLQYIGKQMRAADPAPLREAVAAFQLGAAQDALALHEAERWREELVADDHALERWAAAYPASDLQQLRSLVRAARRDAAAEAGARAGRGWRALFQYLKPWLTGAAGAAGSAEGDTDDLHDSPDDDEHDT